MTKIRLLALLAVVALVLFPTIASAQQPPELPCGFYGGVQIDGADAPEGTVISALTDGNVTATTTTTASGTYALKIAQPEGASYAGKTVTFMIGTDTAEQTGTWVAGGNVKLDLSVGVPIIPGVGGVIKEVKVTSLAAGAAPTASWNATTGVLTLGIPQGEKGATGATGAAGAQGDPGKDASNVFGIIAIVIAAIALLVAAMVMLRKKPA
jgi:hypothetical protein